MGASGVRVGDGLRRHSLGWRLPVLISGLFLAVLVVVLYAAYREVEATLEQGAGDRARQAANQVAGILGPSTTQSPEQLAQAFLRRMTVFGLIVAVSTVLLVRWLMIRVTTPLTAMTMAAEAMAGGDYSRRVTSDRLDEIGRLGRAFNAMSDEVASELTARKRAHELLREREEQLRLYALHSPVAVAMFDRDMKYLVASRRWLEDYRLEGQALVGRSHYEVFPDIPKRWVDIHQRCLAGAVETCDEDPFLRADGRTDWIRWEIRPWHEATGAIGGIIMFTEVVTPRKDAEAALRASEGRYRTLFDYAPDGIVIADSGGTYLDANPSICRMLGYARDQLIGLSGSDIVVPAEVEHIAPALRTIHSRSDYQREWQFRRRDGSVFRADVMATEMPDGNILAMIRDVTERRTLESQYQQAQKMEAVGRLAGGVAHDFNNLLTAILGYCELLLSDLAADDPRRHELTEIQKAGASAAGLTRQLLAFSRKQIIEPTLLDMNVVVTEMRSLLGRLISEDVAIVVRLSAAPALLMADRGQVEQIIVNLAVNARDAMPRGGTMTIETAQVELDDAYAAAHVSVTPGRYVALTVTDTGTGMSPEVQSHLFEPFFTTKEQGKGTGLGLATVHGVVARCGGSVTVCSEVGKGTSLTVYFPGADAAAIVPETPPPLAAPGTGRTHTVLVVDDADGLRQLTLRILERQGYQVLLAGSAAEAVQVFDAHPSIDVLLTDVVMPGASGPELTKKLVERRPGLKVVYMSGYTADTIVHHDVLRAGIAFLHKPFTAEALGRKIREVLDR